jgi:hypothetical protein
MRKPELLPKSLNVFGSRSITGKQRPPLLRSGSPHLSDANLARVPLKISSFRILLDLECPLLGLKQTSFGVILPGSNISESSPSRSTDHARQR